MKSHTLTCSISDVRQNADEGKELLTGKKGDPEKQRWRTSQPLNSAGNFKCKFLRCFKQGINIKVNQKPNQFQVKMAMGENLELTSSYEYTEATATQGTTSWGGDEKQKTG